MEPDRVRVLLLPGSEMSEPAPDMALETVIVPAGARSRVVEEPRVTAPPGRLVELAMTSVPEETVVVPVEDIGTEIVVVPDDASRIATGGVRDAPSVKVEEPLMV